MHLPEFWQGFVVGVALMGLFWTLYSTRDNEPSPTRRPCGRVRRPVSDGVVGVRMVDRPPSDWQREGWV